MNIIRNVLALFGAVTLILFIAVGWQDWWEQRVWEKRKLKITLRKQKKAT